MGVAVLHAEAVDDPGLFAANNERSRQADGAEARPVPALQ